MNDDEAAQRAEDVIWSLQINSFVFCTVTAK